MSDLVGNHEGRFSRDADYYIKALQHDKPVFVGKERSGKTQIHVSSCNEIPNIKTSEALNNKEAS